MKNLMVGLFLVSLFAASIVLAQTNDSIVSLEADVAGIPLLTEAAPKSGTFWLVTPPGFRNGGVSPPFPTMPLDVGDAGDPKVYVLPNGAFLVDATAGDNGSDSAQLVRQMNAVSNIIQQAETVATSHASGMRAMDLSGPPSPGGGDTNGDYPVSNFQPQGFTTNDYWLQFQGISNGAANVVIHLPANTNNPYYAFDIFATTNLLSSVPPLNGTNWTLVAESAPGQTNLSIPLLPGADICFYRWGSMQDSDGDGLTDAYEQLVSHTSPTN
jgi:hypothetical protein